MKFKINGVCNWETSDATGFKTEQLCATKWIEWVSVIKRNEKQLKENL